MDPQRVGSGTSWGPRRGGPTTKSQSVNFLSLAVGIDLEPRTGPEVRAECFDSNARALVDKVASLISQIGFQAQPYDRDTNVDPNSQLAIFYGASIEGAPEPNSEGVLMTIFAAGANMATNARISFELI